MERCTKLERLITSRRWIQFVESTATGLQLNLTFLSGETNPQLQVPAVCTLCRRPFSELSEGEAYLAQRMAKQNRGGGQFVTDLGLPAFATALQDGLLVVARNCTCHTDNGLPLLQDRAAVASKLLNSFQVTLNEGFEGGQRAIELSALRQMNQIVLSLFRSRENALERAFDLILSALIILLDAQGSWLTYGQGADTHLLIKGDEGAVRQYLTQGGAEGVEVVVRNGCARGRLGVLGPGQRHQADTLLPIMAQECIIVFEIEHLFELLQNQLTRVLGAVGSGILLVNQHGSITYANQAAENLLQRSSIALLSSFDQGLPNPWRSILRTQPQMSIKGQMELLTVGEQTSWVDWQINPLKEGTSTVGWIVLLDDRTDYFRWQQAGRQAERLGTTAMLVGALAHELRNPIQVSQGLLQLMGRRREPHMVASYSDLIIRELDRVNGLLNEFLLIGKPAQLEPTPVDLGSFLHELVPLIQQEAAQKEVHLHMDLQPVLRVLADTGQLTQVVLNLIRNAVQAVDHQGTVELQLKTKEDWAVIEVRDNGSGLTPEVLEHIFKPFFTTKERGNGLGLCVAQAIVHNHGGRISAGNGFRGGAVFSVLLPLQQNDGAKNVPIDVLVVVSDERLRYPSEQSLRAANLKTLSAPTLEGAFRLAGDIHPRLLTVDQQALQNRDIQEIKRTWPDTQILVLGEPSPRFQQPGVANLARPLDYTRLIMQVRAMLGGDI